MKSVFSFVILANSVGIPLLNFAFCGILYGASLFAKVPEGAGDPDGGRGSAPPPPLKNHKNTGFLSNTGPDPL